MGNERPNKKEKKRNNGGNRGAVFAPLAPPKPVRL